MGSKNCKIDKKRKRKSKNCKIAKKTEAEVDFSKFSRKKLQNSPETEIEGLETLNLAQKSNFSRLWGPKLLKNHVF